MFTPLILGFFLCKENVNRTLVDASVCVLNN